MILHLTTTRLYPKPDTKDYTTNQMKLPTGFSLSKGFSRLAMLPLLAALVAPLPATAAQSPAQFPQVSSYSLAKKQFSLPADLAGERNLLILYFNHSQVPTVKPWIEEAQTMARLDPDLHYYLLPVSGSEFILNRWWDNASLRGVFHDSQQWPLIVPLYVHLKTFRTLLGLPNKPNVCLLLTDRQGKILWRAYGPLTAPQTESLATALKPLDHAAN